MGRQRGVVGLAGAQYRRIRDRGEDAHILRHEAIEQIGAQQHLVEQVPVIAKVLGTLEVKSAAGLAMVTEMVPHGIVEELVFLALYQAGLALGDAAAHDGVQAAGDDHARLKGVHIEIAEQNGALMTNGGLDLVDALRQVHGLNQLALLGKIHLGGEMGGGDQDALPPRQRQVANRDAMALEQRRQQTRLEAGEEKQVAAVAGSVLVVGRVGVKCLQKHGRVCRTLGQDEDVDVLLMRQATDEAVQVGPVQIPEEEPRHSASVTEAVPSFELRKDRWQFRVSSFKFPVSSGNPVGCPTLVAFLGRQGGYDVVTKSCPPSRQKRARRMGHPCLRSPVKPKGWATRQPDLESCLYLRLAGTARPPTRAPVTMDGKSPNIRGRRRKLMSLDIPSNIKRDIHRFAQQEHITHDEAVLRLIETGLSARKPVPKTVFEQGLGLFGSPEDSALLDEVVSIAYEERRRPSKTVPML